MNDHNADMVDHSSDDGVGRQIPITHPEYGRALELDRRHAILLRGDAASQVKDALARTTREGMRLARTAKAGGDVCLSYRHRSGG